MELQGKELSTSRVDVSVVVSTHQRCDVLGRVLESLVQQEVPRAVSYEIIVVDNNSTDGTRALVVDYMRRYPAFVRYVFEPRPGLSCGRNAGVRAAAGPIVAFTDDDNVVARTWVATIEALLRRNPDASALGGKVLPEWPQPPPAWLDRRHWSPLAILDYGDRPFLTSAAHPLCLITANFAVRRQVLIDAGGFSPAFVRCQDHDLQLRLWRTGHRILYAPESVVFAPVEPKRLTRRYHRQWHGRHGYYTALMRLEESVDERGALRRGRHDTPRFLGSPGYVHRAFVRHAWEWMFAVMRRDSALAAHHEHRVRYLASYVRHTAALSSATRPPVVADAASFLRRHLERRVRRVRLSLGRLAVTQAVAGVLAGWSARWTWERRG